MACVYWIRHPAHTDVFTEGYIGVTKQGVAARFKDHIKSAGGGSKYPVHRALRKYGSLLEVLTLVEAEEDYCYELEGKLRPYRNTGWNIAIGGGRSPLSGLPHEEHHNYGKSLSLETKLKISRANSGRKNGMFGKTGEMNSFYGRRHTEATKEKLRKLPWEFAVADKALWARADELFEVFITLPNKTHSILGSKVKIQPSKLFSMVSKFKAGWKPLEDDNWRKFKEYYGT